MIALLLLLAISAEKTPAQIGAEAACEAEYVQTCDETEDPDCTVPCVCELDPDECEPPPVVTENAPPRCMLEAILFKNFRSSPQALIRVDYLNEDCGNERPKIESETAIINEREVYEGEEPDCGQTTWEREIDAAKPCVDEGCPCLSFMAWVRGLPGTHFIQVYAVNGGYSSLQVTLGRGQNPASEKIAGR